MISHTDDLNMDYKDSDVAIKVESSTAILNKDFKVNVTVVLY